MRFMLRHLALGALAAVSFARAPLDAQARGRGAVPPKTGSKPAEKTAPKPASPLAEPSSPFWRTKAPEKFTADVETSRGTITIELTRAWAPVGVDHFYNLARAGYYDDSRFFRVIYGFIAQFGISKDPAAANLWGSHTIAADPPVEHNTRGTISYAQFKPTDRTTNVFINLRDNPNLDSLKFVPIGRVTSGMEVADSLFANYGELPSSDPPLGDPKRLYSETNKYLDEKYPKLDKIIKITIHTDAGTPPSKQ
jgi:peptidyl-prolyl cis-trans isomerase A (cyclophilin A)